MDSDGAVPLSDRAPRRPLGRRGRTLAVRPSAALGRLGEILNRPACWRGAAAVSAVALFTLLFMAGPGSLQVIRHRAVGFRAREMPAWARPCVVDGSGVDDPSNLAFCARVDGRVIGSQTEHASGESHLLVTGRFHVTLVELPRGARTPGWGSRIVAVGPLRRASDGLRELIALETHG